MSKCGIQTLTIPFECEYIVQGDTIAKTSIEVIETGLDLTTSTIKMQLYNGSVPVLNIDQTDGITIVDSENFEIDELSATDNNLPVGTLNGDLTITDTNGVEFTYMRIQYKIIKKYV